MQTFDDTRPPDAMAVQSPDRRRTGRLARWMGFAGLLLLVVGGLMLATYVAGPAWLLQRSDAATPAQLARIVARMALLAYAGIALMVAGLAFCLTAITVVLARRLGRLREDDP